MSRKNKKKVVKSLLPKRELSDWQRKLLEIIEPKELLARLDLYMERLQEAEIRIEALEESNKKSNR